MERKDNTDCGDVNSRKSQRSQRWTLPTSPLLPSSGSERQSFKRDELSGMRLRLLCTYKDKREKTGLTSAYSTQTGNGSSPTSSS